MVFAQRIAVTLAAAVSLILTATCFAADEVPEPAAKVDSGLGALPPYASWNEPWLYATPLESVDNGLGEMPDVSKITEVWLYAMPGEKLDSGLGEIVARAPQR